MNYKDFHNLPEANKTYLGDGAYACFTGYAYIIITTDGVTIHNEIHLDSFMVEALRNFVQEHPIV